MKVLASYIKSMSMHAQIIINALKSRIILHVHCCDTDMCYSHSVEVANPISFHCTALAANNTESDGEI